MRRTKKVPFLAHPLQNFHLQTALNRHRSPIEVVQWIGNMALTPCLQVKWHGECAVNFWPLTWANATLRLYISITVHDGRMVPMDH